MLVWRDPRRHRDAGDGAGRGEPADRAPRAATGEVLELGALVGGEFELDTIRCALPGWTRRRCSTRSTRPSERPRRRGAPGRGSRTDSRTSSSAGRWPTALGSRAGRSSTSAWHRRSRGGARTATPRPARRARVPLRGGGAVGGAERAVSYSLLAAESATPRSRSTRRSSGCRRRWSSVSTSRGSAPCRSSSSATPAIARARSTDALDAFARPRPACARARRRELLARAAIGFEEACWRPAIHDERRVELLEEAAAALGAEPPSSVCGCSAALTRALDFRGDHARGRRARDEADRDVAPPRRPPDLARCSRPPTGRAASSTHDEINAMLIEAVEIGAELDDTEISRRGALVARALVRRALRPRCGPRRTRRLFDPARRSNEPFRLHVAEHYASALALCDGDLAPPRRGPRSNDWSRLLTGRDASGVHGIQMFGDPAGAGAAGRAGAGGPRPRRDRAGGAWRPGLAAVLADLGMDDEARRELRAYSTTGSSLYAHRSGWPSLTYLADACAAVGDTRRRPWSTRSSRRTAARTSRSVISSRATEPPTAISGCWRRCSGIGSGRRRTSRRRSRSTAARGEDVARAHAVRVRAHAARARRRCDDRAACRGAPRRGVSLAGEIGLPTVRRASQHSERPSPPPMGSRTASRPARWRSSELVARGLLESRDRPARSSSASTRPQTTSAASCGRRDARTGPRPRVRSPSRPRNNLVQPRTIGAMPLYVIERSFAEQLDLTATTSS